MEGQQQSEYESEEEDLGNEDDLFGGLEKEENNPSDNDMFE